MKRKRIAAALFAAILVICAFYLAAPRSEPLAICVADVEKHQHKLEALVSDYQGEHMDSSDDGYAQFDALLRLKLMAVDLRHSERMVFHFSTALPETSRTLCYCPDDRYVIDEMYTVTAKNGDFRLENIGLGGRGYIQCSRICEGWFYVDAYYPT